MEPPLNFQQCQLNSNTQMSTDSYHQESDALLSDLLCGIISEGTPCVPWLSNHSCQKEMLALFNPSSVYLDLLLNMLWNHIASYVLWHADGGCQGLVLVASDPIWCFWSCCSVILYSVWMLFVWTCNWWCCFFSCSSISCDFSHLHLQINSRGLVFASICIHAVWWVMTLVRFSSSWMLMMREGLTAF